MKITKKSTQYATIVSFTVSVLAAAAMLASVLPVYNCVNSTGFSGEKSGNTVCPALDTATLTIRVGTVILILSWAIFMISLVLYIYHSAKHKN